MARSWVPVYTAAGVLSAQIVRGLLEAAGIPTSAAQEGAGSQYALTVGPLGEVDVLVPADRLGEAQELVAAYERGDLMTDTPLDNPGDEDSPAPDQAG